MQCVAIPRFDVGSPGFHLAWTPPDLLGVSINGYDIQRRIWTSRKQFETCISLTSDQLAELRALFELETALGLVLYGPASAFPTATTDLVSSAATGVHLDTALVAAGPHAFTADSIHAVLATQPRPFTAFSVRARIDRITVELLQPTEQVRFVATANAVAAFALRAGKVVDVETATTGTLQAPLIDRVVIYAIGLTTLVVCAMQPDPDDDATWSKVPYLVRGLTLPIEQADPTLTTPAAELAKAKTRLIAGEVLSAVDFDSATPPLRQGVAHVELGRDAERILVLETAPGQSSTEISFGAQLGLLQVHPTWRRILGFGYADLEASGLKPGTTYEYRITGRFDAGSLADRIYDVHMVPTGTVLPMRIAIRDITLRFAQPAVVVLAPAATAGGAARRGLTVVDPNPIVGWDFALTDWSLVIDLPTPVTRLVLNVAPGHSLRYWAGEPWANGPTPTSAVPNGPLATLTFPNPVQQVRCAGSATVFAVRIPAGATGIATVHVSTGPVLFSPEAAPAPPIILGALNLQRPPTVLTGVVTQETPQPSRPEPGFLLLWLPAARVPYSNWPADLPSGPPLDGIAYQIEHRDVMAPAQFGPWTPIQSEDNLVVGSRTTPPMPPLTDGVDLDTVFGASMPASGAAGFVLHLQDVFSVADTGTGTPRPVPALGSYHQYRIRAVDTVGRPSDTWTLSNVVRLEKHVPPPLPVGPQPPPDVTTGANGLLTLRGSPGPNARVIVAQDADLSASDRSLLGTHANAIVLQWGWRASERDLDPTTREFRVYQWIRPPTTVPGTITAVTSIVGGWALSFTTDRVLVQDECQGQWITTGGYPFQITGHDAGSIITIRVRAAAVTGSATPATGPVTFGRPLAAAHNRPASWDQRAAVVPLTPADSYQYVFYDLLTLSPAHPKDTVWVGVSAADAESYIADEIPTAVPNGGRAGNESSIVACSASARDLTRPTFVIPPPLGDIPEIVTEEPTGREVLAFFDPSTLIPGALPAGSPVAIDRCAADDVLQTVAVVGGHVQVTRADGLTATMDFPNPGDEATVIAALDSAHPEALPSRYLLYLLAHHPDIDTLFARVARQSEPFGPYADRLAPKAARYFYRVRQADALGRVSTGGAILPLVIRVPSIAPPSAPERVSYEGTASGVTITLRVNSDPSVAHLLVFYMTTPVTTPVSDPAVPELVRIPNRRDLFPHDGIRLAIADGSLLSPIVKALGDPDVTVDAAGNRTAAISVAATSTDWVSVWTYALSRDGIPSALRGPFGRYAP